MEKNYSIALMVDQRVSEGLKVPLFENNAFTRPCQRNYLLKFNCDIIPIYISRDKNDRFEMEILNPLIFLKRKKRKSIYNKKN